MKTRAVSTFCLFACLSVLGCTGESSESGTGGSTGSSTMTTTSMPESCVSSHERGDDVLFVCKVDIPNTEVNGLGEFLVADVWFRNFRLLFNEMKEFCFENVSGFGLDDRIKAIKFKTAISSAFAEVQAPWPADGRVCVDITFPIYASGSSESLLISLVPVFPFQGDVYYQLQISMEGDLGLQDPDEPIDGIPLVFQKIHVNPAN